MPPRSSKPVALRVSQFSTEKELGFNVTVKRSPKRRTMEIIIKQGEVHLMLPHFVSDQEGMRFLQLKRDWALKMLHKQRQRAEEIAVKQYVEGEHFGFLGQSYPLRIYSGKRSQVQLTNDSLYVSIVKRQDVSSPDAVQKVLWQWYRDQAIRILTAKTHVMAGKVNRCCAGVRLRRTKTKWGHCTAGGVIQYNWQIITAPESVIDYLVAHEVSHLVHPNHGERFWLQVERLYPDYKTQRAWLRVNGHRLVI